MAMGEVLGAVGITAVKDVVLFPLWWYTKGIVYMLDKLWLSARRQSANFAVGIWIKNLFVPMYGQYDWQGRIISFVVRLVQIIVRSIAYSIWLMILALLAVVYLVIPLIFIGGVVFHADLAV
jgi:hypothetical protein